MKTLLIIATIAFGATLARAEEGTIGPIVHMIDGTAVVQFLDASTKKIKRGDELRYGFKYATAPGSSLHIVFEQGIQLFVGSSTAFQLITGKAGYPTISIQDGLIQAQLPIPEPTEKKKSAPKPPPKKKGKYKPLQIRMVIETRPMAVESRGGDFVISSDGEETQLHVLEGTAYAAQEASGLRESDKVKVVGGQYVVGKFNQPIPKSNIYIQKAFTDELYSKNEKLQKYGKEARYLGKKGFTKKTGFIVKKFEKIRKKREEEEED